MKFYEKKECYQLNSGNPTFCFSRAGGAPCSADDCAVYKAIEENTFYLDRKNPPEWMKKMVSSY